jgi:acylphosphatase
MKAKYFDFTKTHVGIIIEQAYSIYDKNTTNIQKEKDKKAVKFIVKGEVQGVGYRYFTEKLAEQVGVYGYVRNLKNGDVEAYVIGTEDEISTMRLYLEKGPRFSKVNKVIETPSVVFNFFTKFHVRYV